MRECLFVLWANGRHCESRIVADLRERFEVRQVVEITWTPGRVADNFQRFYGDIAVRGLSRTYSDVASGQFVAVVGSGGTVEISVRDGSAEDHSGAARDAAVVVECA